MRQRALRLRRASRPPRTPSGRWRRLPVPLHGALVLELQQEAGERLGQRVDGGRDVALGHVDAVLLPLPVLVAQEVEEPLLHVQRGEPEDLLRQVALLGQKHGDELAAELLLVQQAVELPLRQEKDLRPG